MTICDDDIRSKLVQSTFADYSDEYNQFEKKFSRRVKNTDDCYTPSAVYDAVLAWALERYQISRSTSIVRPFYPGGDFERYNYHNYPSGCVVVDNPPFSILMRIIRFYAARGIKFFLFVPALTCLRACSRECKCGVVVAPGANVTYENGAFVRTAFCTNLSDDILEISPALGKMIAEANSQKPTRAIVRRTVRWPDGAICSSASLCSIRVPFRIPFSTAAPIDTLDRYGKLFGGGLLLAPSAVERVLAAREKSKRCECVDLSPREIAMQKKIEEDWRKNYARNQDDEK